MRCVICGHAARRRKITDNQGHEAVKDLCNDCIVSIKHNPNLNIETIDDRTTGDVLLPEEGSQL